MELSQIPLKSSNIKTKPKCKITNYIIDITDSDIIRLNIKQINIYKAKILKEYRQYLNYLEIICLPNLPDSNNVYIFDYALQRFDKKYSIEFKLKCI